MRSISLWKLWKLVIAGCGLIFLNLVFLPSVLAQEWIKPSQPVRRLTWMDCVREAAKHNPEIEASKYALQGADAARQGSYSEFFPQVSLDAGVNRSYDPSRSSASDFSSSSFSSFGGASLRNEYAMRYSANLTLQQSIFDGFRTKGNVDQAKAQARAAVADLALQKSLISYELKTAFAQLIYAQELIGISKDIVERRSLNSRLVALRYESGKENKGSLLLSQANLAQAKFDLAQAERNLIVSQRQLITIIGWSKIEPVEAEGKLETTFVEKNPNFEAIALRTPSHFKQKAQADAASAGITIARSDWMPTISASATASRSESEFPPDSNGWSIGVSASWSIFDAGRTYFNVKRARANLQQSLALLRNTDLDTALSLAQDHKSLIDAIEKVRVEKERLEAVQLRSRIAEAQYRNGLISFQDFETITNDFISQQRIALASKRDAVIAEAAWEQSQGIGAIP